MDLYQPLTSDEDLHLSPSEKEAVLREINRRWVQVMWGIEPLISSLG
ncbi:hypothetical protein PROFUN_04916 [Planoprotostelium fungivorum]|uniref:Uncharacterized protein n=1 Tax=Planoprotostelium fungivorum TaxID=1890364 RepID=A0A2P6NF99_9EUKA|nr:hypothetical protein PROFUN_04916 [Planoprotostelium fungivorum]